MSRPLSWVVVALALLLTLSGCVRGVAAPETDAPRMSTPAATPTPTQPVSEPVDPLTTVTTLVATPESLQLRDSSGTLVASIDYVSDAAAAVATLQAVFGTQPASQQFEGGYEVAPSTVHRWDGFELREQRYVGGWEGLGSPPTLYRPSFRVVFTSPEAGGVELVADGGHRAGDGWAAVLAEPGLQFHPQQCTGPYIDFIDVTMPWYGEGDRLVRVAVEFQPSDDATRLGSVSAPAFVGGCV